MTTRPNAVTVGGVEVVARETNGPAIAALVLGIVGLSLPLVSILALVFGYRARREIRVAPATQTGDGLATAGIVLGWIGTAFQALVLILGLLFVLAFVAI